MHCKKLADKLIREMDRLYYEYHRLTVNWVEAIT